MQRPRGRDRRYGAPLQSPTNGRRDDNVAWRSKLSIVLLLLVILGMELNGMGFLASTIPQSTVDAGGQNGTMVSSLLISKFITYLNTDTKYPQTTSPPLQQEQEDPSKSQASLNTATSSGQQDISLKGQRQDTRTSRCFGKCPQNWRQNLHLHQ